MTEFSVRDVYMNSYSAFSAASHPSPSQIRAANDIMNCKTPALGFNSSLCEDCQDLQIHYCSCGNRNCPQCQQVEKERWIDQRRAEVIDTPYFHVVFTVPSHLRPLIQFQSETFV